MASGDGAGVAGALAELTQQLRAIALVIAHVRSDAIDAVDGVAYRDDPGLIAAAAAFVSRGG